MLTPNLIELSLVESCTRTCYFCPRSDEQEYPNTNLKMDFRLCEKIADNLYNIGFKGTIAIAGYGEPYLHPDIIKVIKLFSQVGKVEIVTNGDLLSFEVAKTSFISGLDKLHVSLYDGPEQVEHFTKLLDSVTTKDKYDLRERWLPFDTLTNRGGTIFSSKCIPNECYYMCYSMMVDWNGDVIMCPQDWRRNVKFGNLNYHNIEDIWYSENYDKYRKPLLMGKRELSPCKYCDTKGTVKGEGEATLWKEYYDIK